MDVQQRFSSFAAREFFFHFLVIHTAAADFMNLLKLFSPNILLSHNHNTIMAAAVAEKFSSHPIPKQTIGAPIYSSAEKIAVKIGPANLRNDDDKIHFT